MSFLLFSDLKIFEFNLFFYSLRLFGDHGTFKETRKYLWRCVGGREKEQNNILQLPMFLLL